jgi:hypothetical protein
MCCRIKLVSLEPPYSTTTARSQHIAMDPPPGDAFPSSASSTIPHTASGQVEYDWKRRLLWVKCAAASTDSVPPLAYPNASATEESDAAERRLREVEGWVGLREVQIDGAPRRAHSSTCVALLRSPDHTNTRTAGYGRDGVQKRIPGPGACSTQCGVLYCEREPTLNCFPYFLFIFSLFIIFPLPGFFPVLLPVRTRLRSSNRPASSFCI